jgi:molecular chaperone GrpE
VSADKNDEHNVTADIPESVFEEALRAVEKIQAEARRGPAEKQAASPKPTRAKPAPPSSGDDDLADLLTLLEQGGDLPSDNEITIEEDEPPVPDEPTRPHKAPEKGPDGKNLESDLQILSKLLEKEYDLEREADFFRSVLWEDLKSPEKPIDESILKEKEGQIQELMANLRNLQTEFEKFRSRLAKEAETAKRFSNEALILKLLPILDNLERAIEHADATEDKAAMVQGVQMILKQLMRSLEGAGLEPLEAKGKKFDPNFHEALTAVQTTEVPPNLVISEFQKGYRLFDRLIRPSRVVVSTEPESNAAEPEVTKADTAEDDAS